MNSDEPLTVKLRYIGKGKKVIYNYQRNEGDVILVPASVAERLKAEHPLTLVQIWPLKQSSEEVLAELQPEPKPRRRTRRRVIQPPTDLDEPLVVEEEVEPDDPE